MGWLRRGLVVGGALMLIVILAKHRVAWALVRYATDPPRLVVPVDGITRRALRSSWDEPRSSGRHHEGIDILAHRGTRVVAAAEGEIVRIGTTDRLGGNTVWIAGRGARLYYYAHLDSFASELRVGQHLHAGDLLGRVGTSGNARGTPPHLHFGIYPAMNAFLAVDPAPLLWSQ
jgi:murein DD-endopeptidase MepM/ murein hydrolase activator NlpD